MIFSWGEYYSVWVSAVSRCLIRGVGVLYANLQTSNVTQVHINFRAATVGRNAPGTTSDQLSHVILVIFGSARTA